AGNCDDYNYEITRTWTATDSCGNSSSCVQTINVEDLTSPIITCPSDVTFSCEESTLPSATGVATATDNCSGIVITSSDSSTQDTDGIAGNCDDYNYEITRTWTATDSCGNSSICVQIINVENITSPIITCPSDVTLNCEESTLPSATGLATATDNCTGVEITSNDSSTQDADGIVGSCDDYTYVITRTWTATDSCGNSSTCVQIINVEDVTNPVITCPSDVTISCEDSSDPTATGIATATDNCSDIDIANSDMSTQNADGIADNFDDYNYEITRTWTATDSCGNSSTCIQIINVEDVTSPMITCPADVTVSTDSETCTYDATQLNSTPATATDNCNISVDISNGATSLNLGSNTVIWTSTDASGNTATCEHIVTVVDNELPTIVCPSNITVDTDLNECFASSVVLGDETTNDNCGIALVSNNGVSSYMIGTTTVIWTVEDVNGNTNTCAQTVNVEDNEPPTITCPVDLTVETDNNECIASLPNIGNATIDDNCSVSSIEHNSTLIFDVGNTDVIWTVTDNAGNTATCVQIITVVDNENPEITCPSDVTVNTDPGQCIATNVALGDPITTDNCEVDMISNDSIMQYELGINEVNWYVTDVSGNTDSCQQIVTVEDNEIPMITCPDNLTVNTDLTLCTASNVMLGNATTSDNCSVSNIVNDESSIYNLGANIITWIVTDGSDNTSSCQQTVTVEDNENPVITCPSDVTTNTNIGECFASNVILGDPTYSDNCGVTTVENDGLENYYTGETIVTWVVEDTSGNTSTCDQLVTVIDNENPELTCPSDLTINTDIGECFASNVSLGDPAYADNCTIDTIYNDELTIYNLGSTMVTWTVVDESDNSATCIQNILVEDNENPMITCPMDLTVNTDLGICTASNVSIGTSTQTDNCGILSINNNASQPFDLGDNIITWTTSDNSGNETTCNQIVTVVDEELPIIDCPDDLTISTDLGDCVATNVDLGTELTSDNCSVAWIENDGPTEYSIGTTSVEWLVIDGSGNSSTCEQTVTVVDNVYPEITCPSDITVNTDSGLCIATNVALGDPVASDNCGILSITNNGTIDYNLGTSFVEWVITDLSNNTSLCNQLIVVVDDEDPTIVCPADITVDVNNANCSAIDIDYGTPIVDDNCGIDTTYNDSNEPYAVGDTIIIWTVVDNSGNSATCIQNLTVNECFAAVDDCYVTVENEAIDIDILVNDIQIPPGGSIEFNGLTNATITIDSSSSGGIQNYIYTYTPNTGFRGIDTFTYTIYDGYGNSSTATVKVDVLFYDLAIRKTTLETAIVYGDTAIFQIEILNQGTLDAANVAITDYLPCGFKFLPTENPDWTFDLITEFADYLYEDTIRANSSEFINIKLELSACDFENAWRNAVEINAFTDLEGNDQTHKDSDSEPDRDPNNDLTIDDEVGLSYGEDDDDHDIEEIEVFDLAMVKILDTQPLYHVGDNLQFDITVVNQGNVPATNITVIDHLPYGFNFNENSATSSWSYVEDRSYIYIIPGTLNPGDSITISMQTELVLQELEQEYYTNIAEISYSTDNNNVERTDADSQSDTDPFNDENVVDDSFSDDNDEDDHDIESIDLVEDFVYPCEDDCDVLCKGLVNVSLDENCMALITPAMVGLGVHERCNDYYTVELYDEFGIKFDEPIVNFSHIGLKITFKLIEPMCGNSCWGELVVEYKLPPMIDCPTDLTLSCFALDQLPLPSAESACSTSEVVLHNEVKEKLECDDDFTHIVTRTYRAFDAFGNESFCVQEIYMERIDLTNIVFPENLMAVNNDAIDCNSTEYEFDADGYPLPWVTDTLKTGSGVPILCDDSFKGQLVCPMTMDSTAIALIPGVDQICNGVVTYSDIEVPTNNCIRKILRTWEVREWWCNGENTNGAIQVIEIVDDQAPEFTCPQNLTVSTTENCISTVQLDSIIAFDACQNDIFVSIETGFEIINTNGGEANLPVGENVITYKVRDNCYNENACEVIITVVDENEPVNICNQDMIISLSNQSMVEISAETFDNGSWDDCGIDYFEVRRMDSLCVAADTIFDSSVHFCCNDIYNTVMVALRVYDISGNYNDCMVEVHVEDKTPAVVQCPSDTIVNCDISYDINNLDLIFGAVEVFDNCSTFDQIDEIVEENIDQCNIGTIVRTFRSAIDTTQIYCSQIISIINETALTSDQISWPENITIGDICSVNLADPEDLPVTNAYPEILGDSTNCDLVGWDYDDNIIYNTGIYGVCAIIERQWTVINWCSEVNGSFETFVNPDLQIISITNYVEPVLDTIDSIVIESIDINCDSVLVDVERELTDDCNFETNWYYKVIDETNLIVATGDSSRFVDHLDLGNYLIEWIVNDGCGNTIIDTQSLFISNIKAPTPVCISGLQVSLVEVDLDNDGTIDDYQVDIWDTDINGGSYHSCGNEIVLSLSQDTSIHSLTFNCQDVGFKMVQLWVTDTTTGIQDHCTSVIEILPHENCMELNMATIQGDIYTEQLEMIDSVTVTLKGSTLSQLTNEQGNYRFDEVAMYQEYIVEPKKDINHLNGVTTVDLILIQRHILGLARITSPYKLIAADINKDGQVTALDLVELRKLILDLNQDFPNNESWRFVDATYVFPDAMTPASEKIPETYEIPVLERDMHIDFFGIKIGDVNESVIPNASSADIDKRSRNNLKFEIPKVKGKTNDIITIPMTSSNYNSITGWQGTLKFDPEKIEVLDIGSDLIDLTVDVNFNMSHANSGRIPFSYNAFEVEDFNSEEELFSIKVRLKSDLKQEVLFEINSDITPVEAYYNIDQILDLKLDSNSDQVASILNVYPNPWIDQASIDFYIPRNDNVRFDFYNSKGELMFTKESRFTAGTHQLDLQRDEFSEIGMIYIKMVTSDFVDDFKMLLIK
ncbi:MAG: HYR domain-containing protein, partial [Saprospiraceae bacterium]|nr:HYR domain-containing protein [Saprospiraceae bacterium]